MVQNFKDIRTKAGAVLNVMSSALIKLGDKDGTIENRKQFVEMCKPIWGPSEVDFNYPESCQPR